MINLFLVEEKVGGGGNTFPLQLRYKYWSEMVVLGLFVFKSTYKKMLII